MNELDKNIPIVIMAGGRGTRIAKLNSDAPKPMIPIEGKPILEHQIDVIKQQGYKKFILSIGYLGNHIKAYFGDGKGCSPATGNPFEVSIQYIEENEPLGTAGALYYLKSSIVGDFLLINGDIIFDVDISRFYQYHKEKKALATIFTHPNDHPSDSALILTDQKNRVTDWTHKEESRLWYRNRVNAGLHFLSTDIFKSPIFDTLHKIDLDRDILKPLIKEKKLVAYDSPEYVKDMGTPERYYEVAKDLRAGRVAAKNLAKKQKAFFLDRDGTLNHYVGFLRKIEDLSLLDGAARAVRAINRSGYLAIVITNQPVIARGEVTIAELEQIHQKLETLLGAEGAYLDAIYYCPHHPAKGFEGEISELKVSCSCRKPAPGLLLLAAEKFHIDLKESWMIGDCETDILAGKNAGCRTLLLSEENTHPKTYRSLLEAVNAILTE